LTDFVAFLDAVRADPPRPDVVSPAAHRLLLSLLQAVAGLLSRAPRHWFASELAAKVCRHWPVSEVYEEAKADLARFLAECRTVTVAWRGGARLDALGLGCQELADLVRDGYSAFSGERAAWLQAFARRNLEKQARLEAESARPARARAGPTEAGAFSWKRKDYAFSLLQWRLLRELWHGRDERDFPRLDAGDLCGALRPEGEPLSKAALGQLQLRTNDTLETWRLPFEIFRPAPLVLQVRRLRRRRAPTGA
jgi:hypothetical protein